MVKKIKAILCWLAGLCAASSVFAGPGTALHFNTNTALVSIPHSAALNAARF